MGRPPPIGHPQGRADGHHGAILRESQQLRGGWGRPPQVTPEPPGFVEPKQMKKEQNENLQTRVVWEPPQVWSMGLVGTLVHRTATSRHSVVPKGWQKGTFLPVRMCPDHEA